MSEQRGYPQNTASQRLAAEVLSPRARFERPLYGTQSPSPAREPSATLKTWGAAELAYLPPGRWRADLKPIGRARGQAPIDRHALGLPPRFRVYPGTPFDPTEVV
jgi:hypothetical protein